MSDVTKAREAVNRATREWAESSVWLAKKLRPAVDLALDALILAARRDALLEAAEHAHERHIQSQTTAEWLRERAAKEPRP